MRVTLCDWKDTDKAGKAQPCGERADLLVQFTDQDGKRWEIDVCSQLHGKLLISQARPAETQLPSGYTSKTTLPRSDKGRRVTEQIVDKSDYADLRKWLESNGDLPEGSRGRISSTLQEKWVEAGSPREKADGTFVKSA